MPVSSKSTVVLDTNVWISGLVYGGNPERIIRMFIDDKILAVTAEELLTELRRKITQRFPLYIPNLALLEESIREIAINVHLGTLRVQASRDYDDNKFIEAALIGNADFIVSGDKDLTDMGSYESIKILKPAEFLELLT
jgi:putative PIN family toxin of toxin-antitoxin system